MAALAATRLSCGLAVRRQEDVNFPSSSTWTQFKSNFQAVSRSMRHIRRNYSSRRGAVKVVADDDAPFLGPKALKRVKKGVPVEKDFRDYNGSIYKEQLGISKDVKLPKFRSYEHMTFGDYIKVVKEKNVDSVELWRDKEPYWWPPWRGYFDGQRALVTLAMPSEEVTAAPAPLEEGALPQKPKKPKPPIPAHLTPGKTYRVDLPLPELEEVAMKTMSKASTNIGFHQPPGREGWTPLDLALIAGGAAVFVFTSIYLGIIRKGGIPMDQVQALEFAQSKSESRKEGRTGVTFADVAALGGVIEELEEVVAFLKAPDRFNSVGARPPKGLLLEGGPGVGKTLIAKAVAGEAGVPFYSMSGPEFVEIIVGVGAARVRDLFKRARVNAPCLIFIDEIDALGAKRAPAAVRGNEEREQTLNQLLTEMDGFTPDTGVIFIAATNRADLLDPALLRPGRFDRKVTVRKPTTEGRAEILKVHAKKVKLNPEVNLDQLARDLPGLSGAELANVLNEAALVAMRRKATVEEGIITQDIYTAIDRILLGVQRTPLREGLPVIRVMAGHEMGKALIATILRLQTGRLEVVERVSILPRGDEWTRTVFARGDDETYSIATRARLLERLQVLLGGMAAEEVLFGEPSTCSMNDINAATTLARRLVSNYALCTEQNIPTYVDKPPSAGMGPIYNMWAKFSGQVEGVDVLASNAGWNHLMPSDGAVEMSHAQANSLIQGAYAANLNIMRKHKAALTAATDVIMEKEQIMGDELVKILDANPVDDTVEGPFINLAAEFWDGSREDLPEEIHRNVLETSSPVTADMENQERDPDGEIPSDQEFLANVKEQLLSIESPTDMQKQVLDEIEAIETNVDWKKEWGVNWQSVAEFKEEMLEGVRNADDLSDEEKTEQLKMMESMSDETWNWYMEDNIRIADYGRQLDGGGSPVPLS